MDDNNVEKMLSYCNKLLGIKYRLWKGDNSVEDQESFYVNFKPPIDYLKKNGIHCSGLINVILQEFNIPIPSSSSQYRGGTKFWYEYFKNKGFLCKFNYNIQYPIGTLFIRKYKNKKDQGHLAILSQYYSKNPEQILYGNIIHSCKEKGVCISQLGMSHFCQYDCNEGYYEYAILPDKWLY